jgi:hypothetical protein
MLLLTLVALQAAAPSSSPEPDMGPVKAYAECVIGKVKEWSKSREEAKVIVETAAGACGAHKGIVRTSIASWVQASLPDAPPQEKLRAIEAMAGDVEGKVRNWGYQALISARTPR